MTLTRGSALRFVTFFSAPIVLAGCLSGGGGSVSNDTATQDASSNVPVSNAAPTITGDPQLTVSPGGEYVFTPQARDPDGDRLTFSASNVPPWADFSPRTGEITGRPMSGDLGIYDDILIAVSDGLATTRLPEFSITVTDTPEGSITVSWNLPTRNVDGTPLTDLAGYRIYYGMDSRRYTERVTIENPSVSRFAINDLIAGTYYLAVTSIDSEGIESDYSSEIVRVVN